MEDTEYSEIAPLIKSRPNFLEVFDDKWVLLTLSVLLLAAFVASFTLGRYGIPLNQLFEILLAKLFGFPAVWDSTVETVLFKVQAAPAFSSRCGGSRPVFIRRHLPGIV